MKYDKNLIEMHGIIVEVFDGAVTIDLKGRLGQLKIPLRMLITDYPLQEGLEVAFMMSFPEVRSNQINQNYNTVKNINKES